MKFLQIGVIGLVGLATLLPGQVTGPKKPVSMKLLVLGADGTEPGYGAMKSFLDHMGVPYDARLATAGLPALIGSNKGNYQGIILTSGNLAIFDAAINGYRSALSAADWTSLDNYTRDYGVRTVSYYTFPEARYGIAYANGFGTSDTAPGQLQINAAGAPLFAYLNTANAVPVKFAWVYTATSAPATGETTTPIMTINGAITGVLHKKADGREYMALTFDNSQYLMHSLVLHYGIVNWVTQGVFLGNRKIYLTPQSDDLFLASDLFKYNDPACQPVGGAADPTNNRGANCPALRLTWTDFNSLVAWQTRAQENPLYRNFRVTHAFNGYGTTADSGFGPNDLLGVAATLQRARFFWVSHTYDHENLDCYQPVPNSGVCTPANAAQSFYEISENVKIANALKLPNDGASMVTPGISGLTNPAFLQTASANGIRYLVTDTSRPDGLPAIPNTGIANTLQPSILMIPRRATNIFYNANNPNLHTNGSELDEYNFLFGPNGYFRIGGPGGPPFFTTEQSYAQILDREADAIVQYMMRGELYPTMYHQVNFDAYNGRNSLFTDLMDAVFAKYSRLSKLPVTSLQQSAIGQLLQERMDYLKAGVQGTWVPGTGVQITSTGRANVPATGFCQTCETYGGQKIGKVAVTPGATVTLPVN